MIIILPSYVLPSEYFNNPFPSYNSFFVWPFYQIKLNLSLFILFYLNNNCRQNSPFPLIIKKIISNQYHFWFLLIQLNIFI